MRICFISVMSVNLLWSGVVPDRPEPGKENVDPRVTELVNTLKNPDAKIRVKALIGLSNLGPKARPAIPAMIELLKDKNPQVRERALAGIAMSSFMNEKKMLRPLGEIDVKIVQLLIPFLDDESDKVRVMAMSCLGNARSKAKDAIPKLLPLLAHEDISHRAGASSCLGAIGPDARAALPALRAISKDRNNQLILRQVASQAIESIEGRGPKEP